MASRYLMEPFQFSSPSSAPLGEVMAGPQRATRHPIGQDPQQPLRNGYRTSADCTVGVALDELSAHLRGAPHGILRAHAKADEFTEPHSAVGEKQDHVVLLPPHLSQGCDFRRREIGVRGPASRGELRPTRGIARRASCRSKARYRERQLSSYPRRTFGLRLRCDASYDLQTIVSVMCPARGSTTSPDAAFVTIEASNPSRFALARDQAGDRAVSSICCSILLV